MGEETKTKTMQQMIIFVLKYTAKLWSYESINDVENLARPAVRSKINVTKYIIQYKDRKHSMTANNLIHN